MATNDLGSEWDRLIANEKRKNSDWFTNLTGSGAPSTLGDAMASAVPADVSKMVSEALARQYANSPLLVKSPSPMDITPARPNMAVQSPSPMDIPKLVEQGSRTTQTTGGGGGGGGGLSISDVFAPLFEALDQQRRNAESRYTSNVGQIQNIYGQIIGARTADIDSIEKAYERLQTAAASRGAATISGIQGREAARQSGNEAVIQSMGLGDVALPTSDVASDASAAAQDVAALNQANWAGMLGAMGATSQDIARADIAGYGYRQGEDIATLTGAKEDYLQNIANQEFELKFQEQQQKLAAQQATAAAAAKAQQDALDTAAAAQQQSYSNFLRYADPLTQQLITAADMGVITPDQVARSSDAFNTFMGQVAVSTPPGNVQQWNGANAASAFLTSPAAEGLTTIEKNIITQAIRSSF